MKKQIAVLENGYKRAGKHTVLWNMEGAASGIYIYKLKVGKAIKIRKSVNLK